jgi:hypothetical protein
MAANQILPLTLFAPVKQDAASQAAAQNVATGFENAFPGLIASGIVHFARVALVPNPTGDGIQAFMVITEFDGDMNTYLRFFWDNGLNATFPTLATILVTPPQSTDFAGFSNWINDGNLPAQLFAAYTASVEQILACPGIQ